MPARRIPASADLTVIGDQRPAASGAGLAVGREGGTSSGAFSGESADQTRSRLLSGGLAGTSAAGTVALTGHAKE